MKRIIIAAAAAIILAMSASAALAKTPEDRIAELERQLQALQKTYMTNNTDVASSVSRAQSMQDEFNSLKGQVETNNHLIKSQRDEMMRLITDLQSRTQAIEDRMGIFSSQVTSAIGKANPAAGAEAELYQKGLDLANSSKYLEAAAAFESFIQKFPKSRLASSARRWVGECFYSMRDYKRAIKEYQIFIEKYPRDEKVADAILKQGNSFYELGMFEDARPFYEKVISSYPGSSEASQAKAKLGRVDDRKAGGTGGGASQTAGSGSVGSSQAAYPTETIEQQRQKMGGGAAQQPAQQGKPPAPQKEKPRSPLPVKEF